MLDLENGFSAAVSAVTGLGLLLRPRGVGLVREVWNAVDELERVVGFTLDADPSGAELTVGWTLDGREALALCALGAHDDLVRETAADDLDDDADWWHELAQEAGVLVDPDWC